METSETYQDAVIRVADLATSDFALRDLTFQNCKLTGPAVLLLMGGNSMTNCSTDDELTAAIWEIPDGQTSVVGAIGLVNCTLAGCRFSGIGFGVRTADLAKFREGFAAS